MILTIARFEGKRLLNSAQTYLIAAMLSLLFGFLFLKQLEVFLGIQNQLASQDHAIGLTGFMSVRYLEPLALAFTITCPLFAMRSFSEEYRQQTIAFWQSAPVGSTSLVLGKFLGIMMMPLLLILLAVTMLAVMKIYVNIDATLLVSAAFGLSLCASLCTACGIFFSSLTRHSMIAIIASLAFLLISWMMGSANFSSLPIQGIHDLSIANHLRGFFQGFLQTRDIALSIIRLDSIRQSGQ